MMAEMLNWEVPERDIIAQKEWFENPAFRKLAKKLRKESEERVYMVGQRYHGTALIRDGIVNNLPILAANRLEKKGIEYWQYIRIREYFFEVYRVDTYRQHVLYIMREVCVATVMQDAINYQDERKRDVNSSVVLDRPMGLSNFLSGVTRRETVEAWQFLDRWLKTYDEARKDMPFVMQGGANLDDILAVHKKNTLEMEKQNSEAGFLEGGVVEGSYELDKLPFTKDWENLSRSTFIKSLWREKLPGQAKRSMVTGVDPEPNTAYYFWLSVEGDLNQDSPNRDWQFYERHDRVVKWWMLDCHDVYEVIEFLIEASLMKIDPDKIKGLLRRKGITDYFLTGYFQARGLTCRSHEGGWQVRLAEPEFFPWENVLKGTHSTIFGALVNFYDELIKAEILSFRSRMKLKLPHTQEQDVIAVITSAEPNEDCSQWKIGVVLSKDSSIEDGYSMFNYRTSKWYGFLGAEEGKLIVRPILPDVKDGIIVEDHVVFLKPRLVSGISEGKE